MSFESKKIFTIRLYLIALFFSLPVIIYAQGQFEFFPSELNIKPFTANTLEPNLGSMFKFNSNELILSIGNSMDMLKYRDGNKMMTFGADLFTWTLLRKEDNFKFPVDAVDYLFGINFSFKQVNKADSYGLRGRISHISAHFVDGHYDAVNQHWRGFINPQVYSREFIELIPFYEFWDFRVYAGLTYIFHVTPNSIHKDNYQIGFDYYLKNYFGGNITPFAGYNLTLDHLDQYTGNNSIAIGIKFGKPDGKGISLQYHYYAGNSLHGEYYNFNEKYSSLGLNLDL